MTTPAAPAGLDIAALERRRRLALRSAIGALVTAVAAFPLGMRIGEIEGSETA